MTCPACGCGCPSCSPAPVAEAVEAEALAEAEAVAAETGAAAQIEVARIEAERDVTVAKIEARSADAQAEADVAALLARLDVLETWKAEMLAAQAPPEPEPVVIPVGDPPAANGDGDSVPDIPPPPKKNASKGYWSGYRR